jgi:hypothetical protein
MRYWKLFVVALVAVCALGASMAVAASALPTLLPETVTSGTGKNIGSTHLKVVGAGSLETVTCTAATGESTVESNHHLGLFHIHFKTCSAGGGLLTCTGLGEETGVILALGSYHLVYDTLSVNLAADGVAILYLVDNTHFECGGKLVIVKLGGMVLCLISHPAALTKVSAFNCEERKTGGPAETKYYNEAGTLTSIAPLLTSEAEGAGKESIQVGEGTNEYTVEVLIMT